MQLAFLITFHEKGVTTERKNISGKILLFQNYSMFLIIFFSEDDDFVRETKIVP
jgi:hypothetical protein